MMVDSIKQGRIAWPVPVPGSDKVEAVPPSRGSDGRWKKNQARKSFKERRIVPDRRQRDAGARGPYELRFTRGRRRSDRLHIPL